MSKGFIRYEEDNCQVYEAPFFNDIDLHFIEKEFHRNMFAVVFSFDEVEKEVFDYSVYVQHDAGCGFLHVPFRWSQLAVEHFEALYFSIRGYKPR